MESYSKYTSNTVLYSKKFCCDRGDERHSSNTFHSSNPYSLLYIDSSTAANQGSSTVVYKVSYAQFNPSIIYERSSEVYERVCEFYVGVRCIYV